jgi:dynein heavy chain
LFLILVTDWHSNLMQVKAYTKPPDKVEMVMQAVMILFGKATDWGTAKKVLGEANFLQEIKRYDKDHVSPATINKIKKYIDNPQFSKEAVKAVSAAAGALCVWVHAIYIYANVAKEVAPSKWLFV